MNETLDLIANAASILTAVVAVWAFCTYQLTRYCRRRRLEAYLKDEWGIGDDGGQRTVLHLVAQLGIAEAEIIDAAFRSKVITRKVSRDEQGRADRLFLVYKSDDDDHQPRRGRSRF
ncbi:hypothetical protein [Rhizobium metallidurans]|uniref:Uncharacterized protein n=1 Tax=Rhizobium metallidurans TaxID=1265931 RepID=A0A7W6CVU6_9HYPH|nr:hypothetical protein [Rhizobium metallidurans]MBB3967184.1 hypothetical protein [Rhizobium metallidurans]